MPIIVNKEEKYLVLRRLDEYMFNEGVVMFHDGEPEPSLHNGDDPYVVAGYHVARRMQEGTLPPLPEEELPV